ncbi:hypothetical protein BEST7613_4404 [Synechocystis sp. PCC 6803]|nr:hypothetical protein BEST7613_4404 [Synechocystis sp. PCC 6803] [Bacillus subtilis BEST7613]
MPFPRKVIAGGEIYLLALGPDEAAGALGSRKVWANPSVALGLSTRLLAGLGITTVVLTFSAMAKLGLKVIARLREKINRRMVIPPSRS